VFNKILHKNCYSSRNIFFPAVFSLLPDILVYFLYSENVGGIFVRDMNVLVTDEYRLLLLHTVLELSLEL